MEQEKVSQLVAENIKTIFAYALSRVSHKEDAEDLAGDIVLAILQSAPKLRDDNAFFGYIWSIAANTYKKYLRRKIRIRFDELAEDIPSEDDFTREILRSEEHKALRRELALLSREYRECTIAYYFDGLSCAETASRLHISLEMVKYYLFKTRKILKEGIAMEREFGTKSYNPIRFEFHSVFANAFNQQYHHMFNRKLPGNILASAYHTPMTIRELAVELGVASVYLEDEIALLEKYHLLASLPGGRYQTSLIIFTDDYIKEFIRTAEESCVADVGAILTAAGRKLPEIRKLGFPGSDSDDNRLLWSLLYEMMRNGHKLFTEEHRAEFLQDELYCGVKGTNYASCYDSADISEYTAYCFAGYRELTEGYAASHADFGILPPKNWLTPRQEELKNNLPAVLAGIREPFAPIVSQAEQSIILRILQPEIKAFGRLYESLYRYTVQIMRVHAPAGVAPIVDKVMANTLLFETTGFIGACAVKSGALTIPDNDLPLAMLIYQTEA